MYAKELSLAIVALEEANKDQTQDDEDARRRLQGHMEVLVCTANFRDAFSMWSSACRTAPGRPLRHFGQPGSTKMSCPLQGHEPHQYVADVWGLCIMRKDHCSIDQE